MPPPRSMCPGSAPRSSTRCGIARRVRAADVASPAGPAPTTRVDTSTIDDPSGGGEVLGARVRDQHLPLPLHVALARDDLPPALAFGPARRHHVEPRRQETLRRSLAAVLDVELGERLVQQRKQLPIEPLVEPIG